MRERGRIFCLVLLVVISSGLNAAEVARSYPSTLPLPSTQLGPFMNGQLGAVLAPLDHNVNAPRQQAVELREKFADEMEMVSEPEKPPFKQAVIVVEMIIGAMDEREAHHNSARARAWRAAVKQWADRANVLRQEIDRAYAVERALERQK